ncbi:ferritin-like domain-containing protein [Paraliomyxa miuraensis]|uniref:ferritin-like domain-containing protein n=1 Tax=Paraliomyxa miuraensis TaxID=376150 RepID=UPI0022511894|nr:ferritin-like domain-containing protein [Paraliomyxa miuraensis]MCX4240541.1 ferritin-like domain-containing protein [Paraliomyxa miuraensis]
MTDFASMHRRLRRALDVSSLLVLGALAPACAAGQEQEPDAKSKTEVVETEVTKVDDTKLDDTKTDDTKLDDTKTDDTKLDDTKLDDTKTVEPPPDAIPHPKERSRPTCPTTQWCAPRSLVESMRTEFAIASEDVEGCPRVVDGTIRLDAKLLEGHEPPPRGVSQRGSLNVDTTKAKRTEGDTETCCYDWTIPCPGGRPLLIDGRPWIAALRAGHGWSARLPELPPSSALPPDTRARIGEQWLHDALTEHASIASFARAREELRGIGAPLALLEACERAAQDEVEHARLCFGLAERYGGRALEPTALPEISPRSADPREVALDTFVEGCVGETIAAVCARRAAGEATDPVARAVLERIADDETEHAALAWRTVAWLVQREGPRVSMAIAALADELRPRDAELPEASPDAAWLLDHGRLDPRALAQARMHTWRELIDPLLAALGGPTTSAPARAPSLRPS